jgi:hypothetical protein
MTWLRALALGAALLLAPACAAPGGETVAGESATRGLEATAPAASPPETTSGAAAVGDGKGDGWLADLGATGVAAAPVAPATTGSASTPAAGPTRRVGELVVTLVEAARTESGARATFAIENRGGAPAVLSPGNYRLRTDGARPRMQLRETPAPLPVGTLQPGQTLHGEVRWELPAGSPVAVVFVDGGDTAEWTLYNQ